jgi:large subunit ribosomal protein L24
VQTTLLGFAFAIILALVTALVGPLFVDWSSYRGEFEARATRLTGLDFRVSGAIDARLLPTPSIMLHGVEFGRPYEASKVSARGLRLEFALGALMRGEWRIAEARLEGPELAAGLDSSGHIAWPLPRLGFDLEGVSVERLQIEDGRAVLADAASDTRVTLENVEFRGEMRSLGGPVKGDGSFVVSGRRYPYRISTGRIAEDGGVKVRLSVESAQPPLTTDADVTIWTEQGTPRFEGSVQMVRPVGRAPAGAQALIIDAWRVTSRIKGDSTAALLDQIEFQYGPDDRAIKLRGNANLTFGPRPEITGVLSSPQIDLDRVLALPDATRRQPPTAIKTMAENLVPMAQLPVPTTLSVAVESVTLAGTMLTRVNVEMKSSADGLEIKALDLRAPGATQLHLSGRLGTTPAGIQFQGSTQVEANDPRAFVAWLTERTEEQSAGTGPWRLAGDVTLGSDAIAIERMKLELDRMTVAGRVAYAWTVEDRPARLDAALTATEIDLDRVQLLAKGMLGGAAFDWPREGALSLKIGRGFIAGVEAKQADVNVKFGATGLAIEQLAVADFGGAALAVKGRIGTNAQAPRGALTLDLDARALDGVTAALEKFAPQTADRLRRSAARLTPLVLRATLAVDPSATGAAAANGKFKIVGRAGAFRVALDGDAGAAADALKLDNLAALAGAKVNVSGRLDGDDGAALIELMGLDRFVVADKRPGRLTLTAKGPLDGELAIDGQLAAGSLNIATNGTLRLAGSASPSAALNLKVANANLRSPRPAAAGRGPEVLPTSANARLTWTDGILGFSGITGTMAGTTIGGRVAIGLQQQPITIDGDLDAGAVDLPAAIAVALGLPAQSVGTTAAASGGALGSWPSEPFEALPRLSGQVAVKSARVKLTPKLAARDVRAVVRFGESELALQAVEGSIAGGKLGAELALSHRPEGLAARASVQLAGVNAAELLPGDGVVTGKLTLDAKVEGSGLSAVALMGSLAGDGTFKLENGRVVRLDPAAFETVMRAVDQGLPIDATRIRDRMDAALASGVLSVALAEGAISVNAGQARLSDVTARAQRADVAVSGSVNLADAALEGRLTLSGMGGTNAPANTRPEITIGLKGPVDTPKRSIDVAALSSWLALRAVEQQSKKLEALEGRAPATAATANANPRTGPTQPALATDAAVPAALHTEPDAADPQPVARPQPATPKAQKPKPAVPTAERAPTLPPPIDVRPAPTPPAPRAAAHGAASQPQPQKPVAAPAPPRQRSWSEILFGN